MTIAVIIVNYKTPDLVIDCLKSLIPERQAQANFDVFVGDALSEDGSVEKIQAYITEAGLEWATVVDIGKNGGFAFGNNYLVERFVLPNSDYDYVHFLNPDTYIHPDAVHGLHRFLLDHPTVGVVGSRLENPDGSYRAYGFRFPTPLREFARGARFGFLNRMFPNLSIKIENLTTTQEVDWVTGASFMMPRKVLDDVGLMDARYFLYFEESDLMFRVRKSGYAIWHVADSRVVHLAGQSTGIKTENPAALPIPPYWYHSRYKFFHDQYGTFTAVAANLMFLVGDLLYRVGRFVRGKKIECPPQFYQGFFAHGFSLPPNRGDQ